MNMDVLLQPHPVFPSVNLHLLPNVYSSAANLYWIFHLKVPGPIAITSLCLFFFVYGGNHLCEVACMLSMFRLILLLEEVLHTPHYRFVNSVRDTEYCFYSRRIMGTLA